MLNEMLLIQNAGGMSTGAMPLVPSHSNPLLDVVKKRKRFVKEWPTDFDNPSSSYYGNDSYEHYSDHDDDDDNDGDSNLIDSVHESNSNTSTLSGDSACSRKSTKAAVAHRIKRGQKIIVTEEKMNEALRDLQIEIEQVESTLVKPTSGPIQAVEMNNGEDQVAGQLEMDEESDMEEENRSELNGIVISDELKAKLREYKYHNLLMSNSKDWRGVKMPDLNSTVSQSMQLMVWTPPKPISLLTNPANKTDDEEIETASSSSFSTPSSPAKGVESDQDSSAKLYRVEEPLDAVSDKRNRLKRKFSQINKMVIEEMGGCRAPSATRTQLQPTSATSSAASGMSTIFYLVDDDESESSDSVASRSHKSLGRGEETAQLGVKIVDVTANAEDDFDDLQETMDI